MNMNVFKKLEFYAVVFLFIVSGVIPSGISVTNADDELLKNNLDTGEVSVEETEYWALLVAVGLYADDPGENRPLMLEEVDDFHDVLLESSWWSEDHIKVIKGKDATVSNIIAGFRWLDKHEDSDDISVVYLTTHGYPLGFDIPPFDEDDGTDEALVSYWGFAYPLLFLWDDQINFLLNRLESKGVCLIVDSCYAGGFNDPPDWNRTARSVCSSANSDAYSAKAWMDGFAEEVRGQGRVVLMASCEDEVSYSGGFAPYLIDGVRGFADSNNDMMVSAEEAFYYTAPRTSSRQEPTMYDGYDGELVLIDVSAYMHDRYLQNYDEKSVDRSSGRATSLNTCTSPENSVICGFVSDAETSDPIENAFVEIWGRDNDDEHFENHTLTNEFGFFLFNVPACRFRISVNAEGYCSGSYWYNQIGENETFWYNFSLYPRPAEQSMVCGYITNETGYGLSMANITLYWFGDENQYYWNATISDLDGFYCMNVAAGEIELEVELSGYFRESVDDFFIEDNEILWFNFTLYPLPEENALVCGYIVDNETSTPLEDARVEFTWYDAVYDHSYENETLTDESGFFFMHIAAGELYLDIRREGYDYYNPYRHDVFENSILWVNESLIEETIEVDIVKPLKAIYINNERLIPFRKARIIGEIDIEANVFESWYDHGEAQRVDFYIDGGLKATVESEPYVYTWAAKTIGKHTITVIAYDFEGHSSSQEIEVFKFL